MAKKNKKILSEKNYKNLVIDPQLKKNYLSQNFSKIFQPNINYYSSLIKNADLIITGPTSMVIEASIFYKKTLLLGHNNNSSSPYSEEMKNFVHLDGVNNLPNVIVLTKESNFVKDLTDTLNIKINKIKIDKIRNYYLNYSGVRYSDKLYSITKKIIND